ncbi:radical SAM family heme chaperone HemW [Desulfovibrio sp. OttesenSCG-928-M14]|nr:radical SAM family heme chaperone HemW [Desulfovibrio sp. OttesenSCG-928-M14]
MLLYIHVPFCRKKCAYCAFFSRPLPEGRAGADLLRDYLTHLLVEMRRRAEELEHPSVASVYFGGGTPSLLPGRALKGILKEVGSLFDLQKNAEISAEANPDSALEAGWLFEAAEAGIQRLSLGFQSLDDQRLNLLGRSHDARAAEAAFWTARNAGFRNIGLDLMWGLPGKRRAQSQSEWLKDLARACDLQPEHLSAYCLTLEENSPLALAVTEGELTLPKDRALAGMYMAGADFLESRGLMHYEVANFARMGFQCRHNLGYWEGVDYLGLGPGAVSTLKGQRESNPKDMPAWRKAAAGLLARDCEILSAKDKLNERLMLGLRTSKGLDLALWRDLCGRSFLEDNGPLVGLLRQKGLASLRQGRLRLSRNGMLVADAIIAQLLISEKH